MTNDRPSTTVAACISEHRQQPLLNNTSLQKFTLSAIFWSIVSNLTFFILQPFPSFRLEKQSLHADDCFQVPQPEAVISNDITDDDTNKGIKERHVAVVTGSNTGIGYETALSLAERGYEVILACRSRDKGERAAKRINDHLMINHQQLKQEISVGRAIFLEPLDLSNFASIHSFHKAFEEKYNSLNILCNNAGMISKWEKSTDGFDLCFQSNFMGHYLLTRLLIPSLTKAQNIVHLGEDDNKKIEAGRIVNLSSVMHHFRAANGRYEISKYDENEMIHYEDFWKGSATHDFASYKYGESKLAAILFTIELNRRYGKDGIRSVAANPGSVNSDIYRNYPKFMKKITSLTSLDTKQGSSTSIAAAVGNLPKNAFYLQPYWQPRELETIGGRRGLFGLLFSIFRKKSSSDDKNDHTNKNASFQKSFALPFPVTEMLGPYIGHAITEPRLPRDEAASAGALWKVCEELTRI